MYVVCKRVTCWTGVPVGPIVLSPGVYVILLPIYGELKLTEQVNAEVLAATRMIQGRGLFLAMTLFLRNCFAHVSTPLVLLSTCPTVSYPTN